MLIGQIREDLQRIANLAANLSDAHTCALFLPTQIAQSPLPHVPSTQAADGPRRDVPVNSQPGAQSRSAIRATSERSSRAVELVAAHTLSSSLLQHCRIAAGSGVIGWVAENSTPIHVAPFDLDTSALGIYAEPESLKSVLAVPFQLPNSCVDSASLSGVLMCDSRKAFAFTTIQIKHLEEIAALASRLLFWGLRSKTLTTTESSWDSFLSKTDQLGDAIGYDSIELVRITPESFSALEGTYGISLSIHKMEQFMRLTQQALPPHFPIVRLPNGEILIALDNMMTTFFQNKIRTLAHHLSEPAKPFTIRVQSHSAKSVRGREFNVDTILKTITSTTSSTLGKVAGGTRA